MSQERRSLAALMLTDICGYTQLVERNEGLAMLLLEEHCGLLRPIFTSHNGREIKLMGDAFLVEFPSAVQATRCAVEVQKTLVERNASSSPDIRIEARIGLHIGDVVHRDDDVFGDGVNVVSRIEPLAEPGGVCVSRQIYDQVWNKIELSLESLGEKRLRNVEVPIELFRVVLPWKGGSQRATAPPAFRTQIDLLHSLGFEKLLKHPRYGLVVERLLRNLVRFHDRHEKLDPSAVQLIRAWLESTAGLLEGVDANQFDIHLEDVRIHAGRFLQLVEEGDKVYSTNYMYTPLWWGTRIGEDYARLKINASRRGADIVQVFVESDADSLQGDRPLMEKLVGPHGDKGTLRTYVIAERELVRDQCLDLFLISDKVAFKLDLEARTWIKGFELFFSPSEGMNRLERYYDDLMQQAALIEYDPHGLYGGVDDFDELSNRLFGDDSHEEARTLQ